MPLTDTGLAIGAVRNGHRVVRVFDAAAGRYAWVPNTTSGMVREQVTVSARNTLANLTQTPVGAPEIYVNGVVVEGITNAGAVLTVNATTVGFNIDPVDIVWAEYSI